MLRKPVFILAVVLVGVVVGGTMMISDACHAPSAKADAYIVQLAGLIEIASGDAERLLAQWAAAGAVRGAKHSAPKREGP